MFLIGSLSLLVAVICSGWVQLWISLNRSQKTQGWEPALTYWVTMSPHWSSIPLLREAALLTSQGWQENRIQESTWMPSPTPRHHVSVHSYWRNEVRWARWVPKCFGAKILWKPDEIPFQWTLKKKKGWAPHSELWVMMQIKAPNRVLTSSEASSCVIQKSYLPSLYCSFLVYRMGHYYQPPLRVVWICKIFKVYYKRWINVGGPCYYFTTAVVNGTIFNPEEKNTKKAIVWK